MQVQIKFTVFGCCSAIGNFEPGDTARVSAEMAKHLVEEARCAKYIEPAHMPIEEVREIEQMPPAPRARRRSR